VWVICGFGSFSLFFRVFCWCAFGSMMGMWDFLSFVFVLNGWRESFLCCVCGLCGRGKGELRVYASMAVVEALFC
jgi:hypothetical protein